MQWAPKHAGPQFKIQIELNLPWDLFEQEEEQDPDLSRTAAQKPPKTVGVDVTE